MEEYTLLGSIVGSDYYGMAPPSQIRDFKPCIGHTWKNRGIYPNSTVRSCATPNSTVVRSCTTRTQQSFSVTKPEKKLPLSVFRIIFFWKCRSVSGFGRFPGFQYRYVGVIGVGDRGEKLDREKTSRFPVSVGFWQTENRPKKVVFGRQTEKSTKKTAFGFRFTYGDTCTAARSF